MRSLEPTPFTSLRRAVNLRIIFALFFCPGLILAADENVWSDRIETNFTVDGEKWGLGGRAYINHDATQLITRYRINDRYSAQFRWVTQNQGEAVDYRFRLQRKDFKRGPFFWNTRVELRLKESTPDTVRFRPQTGLKFPLSDKIQAYYLVEPHVDFDLSDHTGSFKFVRHLVGFDYRPHSDITYGPFLKFETDQRWATQVAYLGFQIHLTLRRE